MAPKFRCWFKDSGLQAAHIVEWDKLKEFVGLDRLFDDSKKSTLFNLMQSTGLKDKNGVEIFEGDICEWHIPDMGKPEPDAMIRYVSVVEYRRGSFNLSGYLFPNVRLIKVLGNIYENPELLEPANEN